MPKKWRKKMDSEKSTSTEEIYRAPAFAVFKPELSAPGATPERLEHLREHGFVIINDFVDKNTDHETIDMFPYVQRCTLDMILETAMGVESDIQNTRESCYLHSIQRICHIFLQRHIYPWHMVCFFVLYFHL